MKNIYLLCAVSIVAAVVAISAGTSSAATRTVPAPRTLMQQPRLERCPPNVYDCCDGTLSTTCQNHGGKCGIFSMCGVQV